MPAPPDIMTLDAVILDLDGVITDTAGLHARAWKQMFDAYLEQRGQREQKTYDPFDIDRDYPRYVDGKPRYDGVRSFLDSRGISLPDGSPDDGPGTETVCGLGNRKNELFHKLLESAGVTTFDDALEQIRRWRQAGLKTAVVSSSRNCGPIIEAAGIGDLFDAKVDGVDQQEQNFDGKPAPDLFLEAAKRLNVRPERAAVFEDAIAGVQAGRAGDFGLVVGVARRGQADELRQHGADVTVGKLTELAETRASPADRQGRNPTAGDSNR